MGECLDAVDGVSVLVVNLQQAGQSSVTPWWSAYTTLTVTLLWQEHCLACMSIDYKYQRILVTCAVLQPHYMQGCPDACMIGLSLQTIMGTLKCIVKP